MYHNTIWYTQYKLYTILPLQQHSIFPLFWSPFCIAIHQYCFQAMSKQTLLARWDILCWVFSKSFLIFYIPVLIMMSYVWIPIIYQETSFTDSFCVLELYCIDTALFFEYHVFYSILKIAAILIIHYICIKHSCYKWGVNGAIDVPSNIFLCE